jgi:hypothetical protein
MEMPVILVYRAVDKKRIIGRNIGSRKGRGGAQGVADPPKYYYLYYQP